MENSYSTHGHNAITIIFEKVSSWKRLSNGDFQIGASDSNEIILGDLWFNEFLIKYNEWSEYEKNRKNEILKYLESISGYAEGIDYNTSSKR